MKKAKDGLVGRLFIYQVRILGRDRHPSGRDACPLVRLLYFDVAEDFCIFRVGRFAEIRFIVRNHAAGDAGIFAALVSQNL